MNESDTDANAKAIDSLLNYETVKYFSAEEREAQRYDRSMARYEEASVQAYTSLAVLNAGQAIDLHASGLPPRWCCASIGIEAGTKTIGDFVMINAMMIQLYQPLNFMGMVYREIKQAVIDIETMFSILARKPEIEDRPGAPPLKCAPARSASRTCVSPTSRRGRSCKASASRSRPGAPSRSSARPAPASRPSRGCCSASTT